MANTYSQIYIHIVFAVKGRQNLISEEHRIELEKILWGIIMNNKSKPLAIFCNPDHTHAFMGLCPDISIATMARDLKANSSRLINEKGWIAGKFQWQDGYGAFSYSNSHIDDVIQYILNQPVHHKEKSFQDEYLNMLKKFQIKFNEKYLFE